MLAAMSSAAMAVDDVWFDGQKAVTYQVNGKVHTVVGVALNMFCNDMQLVTGQQAQAGGKDATIQIYQLDAADNKIVKALKAKGVPVDELSKKMDAFFLTVDNGITIVGNNGRGTAYGILELSRMAGVSPWVWWGDVTPEKKSKLSIEKGFKTLQAPSVEYRGIFINDEDWTLRPWSNKVFEPSKDKGQIGPKTNKKVYELLLRLRANAIWPAMHTGSTAFFKIPGNKEMADSCGIVVGTSHCEPLLRNNVDEWSVKERGKYNYVTNKESVQNYWIERLKEVKGFGDYYYTIGMRGIHDGEMEGVGKDKNNKTKWLQQVIDDQRELLKTHIDPKVESIPQVFVPYKEVLEIMENGLNVPDDVTLMWCDDNYGYMTRLSDAEQQKRSGGAGVYYHLSYWGRPHDYMWLTTEQPGLVYNEMREAYDHNARKLWIVNVHEPKVAAYDLELFLDMAWDINSVSPTTLEQHLQNWLSLQFGKEAGAKLLPVMKEYFRLCGIRRPEFMGWNQVELDKKKYSKGWSPVQDSEFSFVEFGGEMDQYMADYEAIKKQVDEIAKLVRPDRQDAYYAAIKYPIFAAAAMATKHLEAQKARRLGSEEAATKAQAAYEEIRSLTNYYNNKMAGGKWKGMMTLNPRKLYVFDAPIVTDTLPKTDLSTMKAHTEEYIACNANDYKSASEGAHVVQMLGHSMNAVSLPKDGTLTYEFTCNSEGDAVLYTGMIPTQPNDKGDIRFSVSIDGGKPVVISMKEKFRSERWKQNMLRSQALRKTPITLTKGKHTLVIKALDNHIIADQWMIDFAKDRKFYVIPVGKK
ncbi:MAG: glycosyl hydrolase 115 family protein [Prevotella sp.]|nr:glycosyl hydrolase 115 family protein [Prevotella sp.]